MPEQFFRALDSFRDFVLTTRRWLVTGACGRLGSHVLIDLAKRAGDCLGISRRSLHADHGPLVHLDLLNEAELSALLQSFAPTHIVHLAGVTSPSVAVRNVEFARRMNVTLTAQLVEFAAGAGAHLTFASSDFVWSGTRAGPNRESDTPTGEQVYAQQKILGEQLVLSSGVGAVARYSLMYGLSACKQSGSASQLAPLRSGEPVRLVDDEFRTPLSLKEAARATVAVADSEFVGVVHVAGPDRLTPLELMSKVATALAVTPSIVRISRLDLDPLVVRPRNMTMATDVIQAEFPAAEPGRATSVHLRETFLER